VRQSCTESFIPSIGEGLAVLASSLNTMKTMATRDIYETDFDEDVQTESNANQCPECDGHVTTNTVETVCEDCGLLVIDEQQRSITGRSGGRTTTRNANERAPCSLRPVMTEGSRRRSVGEPTRRGTNSQGRSGSGWHECAVNRPVDDSSRKLSETSHTAWVKFEESQASLSFQVRSVIKRANCSGALKPKTCFEADQSRR